MGKTSFARAITKNVAVQGYPVAFFSLEENIRNTAYNMLVSDLSVDAKGEHKEKGFQVDFDTLIEKVTYLAMLPIYFDDSLSLSIIDLQEKCKKLKTEKDIQLIVVDYLQLIQTDKAESREKTNCL